MKLRPCKHPTQRGDWCPTCGALKRDGEWIDPATMTDPKRHVRLEDDDLPPYADRRAWELFAAAVLPTAIEIVATEMPSATTAEKHKASAIAAGILADAMVDEWEARFDRPA
jgi:hypothetical protein